MENSWQPPVTDACQSDLHKSPCTLSWRRRKKWKYVVQLPVQGDQSLWTGHCSSLWLKGRILGCRPEPHCPWIDHEATTAIISITNKICFVNLTCISADSLFCILNKAFRNTFLHHMTYGVSVVFVSGLLLWVPCHSRTSTHNQLFHSSQYCPKHIRNDHRRDSSLCQLTEKHLAS